jgi:hypothetical protein
MVLSNLCDRQPVCVNVYHLTVSRKHMRSTKTGSRADSFSCAVDIGSGVKCLGWETYHWSPPGTQQRICEAVLLFTYMLFMICCWILHKVNFTWIIIHTNKCTTYINIVLYFVSTPTCFIASASFSGSLYLVLCQSYRIIKITTQ